MAWGRRCNPGCESWPDSDDYKRCPVCGETTTRFSNLRPLGDDEAASLKAHCEFEVMYRSWCKAKGQSVDGPLAMTPEESLVWDQKYPGGRPDNAEKATHGAQ